MFFHEFSSLTHLTDAGQQQHRNSATSRPVAESGWGGWDLVRLGLGAGGVGRCLGCWRVSKGS